MRLDFYELVPGNRNTPQLRRIEEACGIPESLGISLTIEAAREKFAELVSRRPDLGSVLLMCPTAGEAPGVIVAVETPSAGGTSRELHWLVTPPLWRTLLTTGAAAAC